MFDREFEDGQLNASGVLGHDNKFGATIELGNRYLTLCKDAPDMQAIVLGKGIDPHGILGGFIEKGTHVHGEDNRVQYYTATGMGEGGQRCGTNSLEYMRA